MNSSTKLVLVAGILLALVSLSFLPAAAQSYSVTDLGTLGGQYSGAFAVNDRGQVVGLADLSNTTQRAFIWSAGTGMRNLGLLHASDSYSIAYGINNSAQVVGVSGDFGFLWQSGSGMQDLGSLGGVGTIAYGINSLGDVVGSSNTIDGSTHAFFWTASDGIQDIGTLGSASIAYAVNDSEEVVGLYVLPDLVIVRAFKWRQATGMVDLGTLGGPTSSAYAINANGQIAGVTDTAALQTVAFVWDSTRGMQSLNFQGTVGFGLSASGQVVGYLSIGSSQSGFIWTKSSGVQNLSGLIVPRGTFVSQANGINRSGQIAAQSDKIHALLLTPHYDGLGGGLAQILPIDVIGAISIGYEHN